MKKRKILMTASTLPRFAGDTEPRFILDLAKELNKNYDVTILAPADPMASEQEVLEGVKIMRYHYFPIRKWETLCYPGAIVPRIKQKKVRVLLVPFLLFSLKNKLRELDGSFDLVHAHWLIPQGIMQRKQKTPYLVTGHGGDVTSLNVPVIRGWKKECMEKAAHITVVSEALKQYVEKIYPNSKTTILPMGCDTKLFSPVHHRKNFFNQQDKKVILFVGRLAEKKGVTYLIEAMKQIDDAILVIVGKGDLEDCLKEQAKEQGDKIRFIGAKTHSQLPEIYASADVFAAPSITASDGDKEGFGLVILEAMASGIPVVASASGGITDIIHNGENGLLSEEKNVSMIATALKRVLADDALRMQLIHNGIQTAQKYSYETIAKKYADIYEQILSK